MVGIEEYIRTVLKRYGVDTGLYSPVRSVQATIIPVLNKWGGKYIVDVRPSGSFAKGTAVHGGTDIDIFISLTSSLNDPLKSIYDTLFNALSQAGYVVRRQNVSIGITVGGWKVDVTPGRRQDQYGNYHSLWSNKSSCWLQTNINEHIRFVTGSARIDEICMVKIWRNRFALDWPSFYLELFVIDALKGARIGDVKANLVIIFRAIDQSIATCRLIDPANTNNVVSASLMNDSKAILALAARSALNSSWETVFQ